MELTSDEFNDLSFCIRESAMGASSSTDLKGNAAKMNCTRVNQKLSGLLFLWIILKTQNTKTIYHFST